MSWFGEISNPESIAAICTGISTIIGAISAAIYKNKSKSWKSVVSDLIKQQGEIIAKDREVIKDALQKISDLEKKSSSRKLTNS